MLWRCSFLSSLFGVLYVLCICIVVSFFNLGMFFSITLLKIWYAIEWDSPSSMVIISRFVFFMVFHISCVFLKMFHILYLEEIWILVNHLLDSTCQTFFLSDFFFLTRPLGLVFVLFFQFLLSIYISWLNFVLKFCIVFIISIGLKFLFLLLL